MGVDYCHYCGNYIDFDYDVDHFPVQNDVCYDNEKCHKYYEQLLTEREYERFMMLNEIEFIMCYYFKYGKLTPMQAYTLKTNRRYLNNG